MRWTRTSTDPGLEPDTADRGLRVEPIRVGPRRSASGLAAAGLIAVGLGLALAKPWAPATSDEEPRPPDGLAAASSRPAATPATPATSATGPVVGPAAPAGIGSASRTVRVAEWSRLVADADHLADQPIVTDRDLAGIDGDGTC